MTGRSTVTLTTSTDWRLYQWLRRGPSTGTIAVCEIRLQLHVILIDILRTLHDTCVSTDTTQRDTFHD